MSYRLPPAAFEGERRRLMRSMYFGYLVAVLGATALMFRDLDFRPGMPLLSSLLALTIALSFSMGVAFVFIFRSLRLRREWWNSYRLAVDDTRVRVYFDDGRSLELQRDQVTGMYESLDRGLWVQTRDATRTVFIPRALNGYDEVRRRLARWRPLPQPEDHVPLWRSAPVFALACLTLLVVLWNSVQTTMVAFAAAVLMVLLILAFIHVVRNPLSTTMAKRLSWVYLAMAAVTLIRVYQVVQIPSWYK